MKLYWKVKIDGKWTFRKADFIHSTTLWGEEVYICKPLEPKWMEVVEHE